MATVCEPYICKDSTQHEDFLKKYPEFDGREILIAIIDGKITDLSLPGMQKTTHGLPKVVDCFDFSLMRFVDISIVKEVDSDNKIYGISGLPLKENEEYKAASERKDKNEWAKVLQKITETLSPYMDCIVWFDGDKWRACIDTSFSKDLENIQVLTNFQDQHEFGILWDKISYCIKIHVEENQLEIISAFYTHKKQKNVYAKNHGTVVSHIAAAHIPLKPHKDGIAPGAQIISISVSTSVESLKKALFKCVEMAVDIVNISLILLESHEISEIVKKMVEKNGIIFVISAKNDGPLYSSIQRGYRSFHDDMLVIGSILTVEMKKRIYQEVFENDESPIVYCYSSKGILNSGARGIDFTAPGAVITAVPKWCESENQIYEGTSMAAPIVTGLIACLLSALKANSIPYTPASIKFALSQTAFLPQNCSRLEFGNGIIQINAAFEYFKKHVQIFPKIIFAPKIILFESKKPKSFISIFNFKNNKKGIVLIKNESNVTENYCVILKDKRYKKISWLLRIEPNSAKFVQHSESVKKRMFSVKINTNTLQNGSINYAEIHGFNASNPSIGALFHLPITVIIPEIFQHPFEKVISLNVNNSYNLFFSPPPKSRRCIVKLSNLHEKDNCVYVDFADIDGIFLCDRQTLEFSSQKNTCCCYFPINEQQKIYEISFYRLWYNERFLFNLEINFDETVIDETIIEQNGTETGEKTCNLFSCFDALLNWFKSLIL